MNTTPVTREEFDALEARVARLDGGEMVFPAYVPEIEPAPVPIDVSTSFEGSVNVESVEAHRPIPVTATVSAPHNVDHKVIVAVDIQKEGNIVSTVCSKEMTVSGTSDVPLTVPPVPEGDYDLVMVVADSSNRGRRDWWDEKLTVSEPITVTKTGMVRRPIRSK